MMRSAKPKKSCKGSFGFAPVVVVAQSGRELPIMTSLNKNVLLAYFMHMSNGAMDPVYQVPEINIRVVGLFTTRH